MKEFVGKIIGRLEEQESDLTTWAEDKAFEIGIQTAILIVNQLAEEYINCSTNISTDKTKINDNDLMIVESLPSLYPMKEFEEEALKRVIGCSKKEYNNGWIPCEKKLPETNESVLCWAKSTARGGDVCFVGSYHKGFWFLQSSANTHSFPGQYKIVAWQKLPEPFKPSAE